MDQKPTQPGRPDERNARDAAVEKVRRTLDKKRELDDLRRVYHERRQTMTDVERKAISDEMARLRQELAEMEGAPRG